MMEMATITIPMDTKTKVEQYLLEIGANWTDFLEDAIGIPMSEDLERVLVESERQGNHPTTYTTAEEMLLDLLSECDDV